MYSSTGILKYGFGIRACVYIDQGIADLYRSLCPKYYYVRPQLYPAHITIVRIYKEIPTNMEAWDKYEGEEIPFQYSGEVFHDKTYFYLNVWSKRIGDIREELGLPRFRKDGCYHITIGSCKY